MITQYPHFLFVRIVAESTQDGEGNWIAGSDSWNLHSICREETNGKGSMINGQDGKAIVFSSTVYLPKSASRLKEGSEVLVSETNDASGQARIKGIVLKYDASQLNNRLWV